MNTLDCLDKIKSMGHRLVYVSKGDDRRVVQETLFIREDLAAEYDDIDVTIR